MEEARLSRRAVVASAAWAVPAIAVAAAVPAHAASTALPDAQSTVVLGNTEPNAGTDGDYIFFPQVSDGAGGFTGGGSYKAGWYVDIVGRGAGWTSVTNLTGLIASPTVPGRYVVPSEQPFVRFRLNGFTFSTPPGTVTATMYNVAGLARRGVVVDVQPAV